MLAAVSSRSSVPEAGLYAWLWCTVYMYRGCSFQGGLQACGVTQVSQSTGLSLP
jgi:hypothetical protein